MDLCWSSYGLLNVFTNLHSTIRSRRVTYISRLALKLQSCFCSINWKRRSLCDTRCNSYLACQLLTGLTMRAVILVSAQLIAVLTRDVDIVNFALGVVLASTLVLSQIRAFQIWLASIKKDKNCLLPRVMQNFRICMSTNYLAAATLYKKVSVEASDAVIA